MDGGGEFVDGHVSPSVKCAAPRVFTQVGGAGEDMRCGLLNIERHTSPGRSCDEYSSNGCIRDHTSAFRPIRLALPSRTVDNPYCP